MKLRLRENSIRLRLLQSEVKKLRARGFVSEAIAFPFSRILIDKLEISAAADQISAQFVNDEIIISIPAETAGNWIETELVGIENEQKIDRDKILKILIEKDFACFERPRDKDKADALPRP